MDTKEKVIFLIDILGVLEMVDKWRDTSIFYLVDQGGRQYWVNVTKKFIISKRLAQRFGERKSVVIGDNNSIRSNLSHSQEKIGITTIVLSGIEIPAANEIAPT